MNFIGVSSAGVPISQDSLVELCPRSRNANQALLVENDLQSDRADAKTRELLNRRLECAKGQQAGTVENGVVNLVPLWAAAEVGDMKRVVTCLRWHQPE